MSTVSTHRSLASAAVALMLKSALAVACTAASFTALSQGKPDAERLSMAVFPGVETGQAESFQIVDRYMPLAKYLGGKAGAEVVLIPVKLPDVAINQMVDGRSSYKLFFGPPVFASEAIKRANYVPLVMESERIRGAFVVRADSPIKTVDDLHRQPARMALPAPTLLLSILAKETLAQKQVDTRKSPVQHMASAQALILALENNQVDIAVVRDRSAKKLLADNPGRYRVVGETVDAPGFALVAHGSLPESVRQRLRQAALALNEDGSLLANEARVNLKTSPFVASRGDDFAALHRIMQTWKVASK
jgi:ABC-type phosphate/phosphonate transport system substrate-binding protein